jgi:hypothetical protein
MMVTVVTIRDTFESMTGMERHGRKLETSLLSIDRTDTLLIMVALSHGPGWRQAFIVPRAGSLYTLHGEVSPPFPTRTVVTIPKFDIHH